MSNKFRGKTATPVFRHQHQILRDLATIPTTTRRANANVILRFVLSKRRDSVLCTRTELTKATGLRKKALPAAIADINRLSGLSVMMESRKGYRFKIEWQTAEGKRRSYFEVPEASLTLESPFSALVYDSLCATMDRTGQSRIKVPYELTADGQGRSVTHAVNGELTLKKLVQTSGEYIEMLNPDTLRRLSETPDITRTAEESPVYCEYEGIGRRVWLDYSNPELSLKYFRITLPDEVLHAGQNHVRCPNAAHHDTEASMDINIDTCEFKCHGCGWFQGRKMVTFEMCLSGCSQPVAQASVNTKLGIKVVPPPHVNKVSEHIYRDAMGKPLYKIERFEKTTSQSRCVLGKFITGLGDMERTLYNLPEVINASVVLITEGEKKADAVTALHLLDAESHPVAVTCTGNWNSWRFAYANYLLGKRVIILPDGDEHGPKYAQAIEGSCKRNGIEYSIVTFEEYGNDVRDLLSAHATDPHDALLQHINSPWLEKGISI